MEHRGKVTDMTYVISKKNVNEIMLSNRIKIALLQ